MSRRHKQLNGMQQMIAIRYYVCMVAGEQIDPIASRMERGVGRIKLVKPPEGTHVNVLNAPKLSGDDMIYSMSMAFPYLPPNMLELWDLLPHFFILWGEESKQIFTLTS